MLAHAAQHGAFAIAGRCHRGVSALAGERNPARRGRDEPGHAEPGSWTEYANWCSRNRNASAYRLALLRRKVGQGQRQGGEVVDHLEASKTELRPQSGD